MTEENETQNPEEEGQAAPAPYKTEIESIVITDDDGDEWETTKKTRKYMKPNDEIVILRRHEVARYATCGHQITDTKQIMRCMYQGHHVCHNCITQCDICLELVCNKHSGEYEYHQEMFRLCFECARKLETLIQEENTITNKILRLIKNKFGQEE
jgi:superfamily II helicase